MGQPILGRLSWSTKHVRCAAVPLSKRARGGQELRTILHNNVDQGEWPGYRKVSEYEPDLKPPLQQSMV